MLDQDIEKIWKLADRAYGVFVETQDDVDRCRVTTLAEVLAEVDPYCPSVSAAKRAIKARFDHANR